MRESHAALHMVDDDRLGVVAVIASGRAVAHMADSDAAGAECVEPLRREYIVDEAHILIRGEQSVIVDDDAAGLLPAVLQRKQSVVRHARHIVIIGAENAKYAAFFVNIAHVVLQRLIRQTHGASSHGRRPPRRPCRGGSGPCRAFRLS